MDWYKIKTSYTVEDGRQQNTYGSVGGGIISMVIFAVMLVYGGLEFYYKKGDVDS